MLESLFTKAAEFQAATLSKKAPTGVYFPVNLAKFLSKPFFIEQLWWLLLWPV